MDSFSRTVGNTDEEFCWQVLFLADDREHGRGILLASVVSRGRQGTRTRYFVGLFFVVYRDAAAPFLNDCFPGQPIGN